MVDLAMFTHKLDRNWVVTSIPDGQAISIYNLGQWIIEKGEWQHTKESFFEYVYSLVKRLNPTLENLHNYNGTNSKMIGQVHVAKHFIPNSKPYFLDDPKSIFPKKVSGEKFNIFYKDSDSKIYLSELSIYKSGQVEITNIPEKRIVTFDNLQELIKQDQLISNPTIGDRIYILGLGSFILKSGEGIDIDIKLDEFKDKFDELNGRESSVYKCARIFGEYKNRPTLKLKKELKEAYENIPEHKRMYVGDMDTKDYEVRLIIYGDQVKKEWEEDYGCEYPFDDMPKPIDEL